MPIPKTEIRSKLEIMSQLGTKKRGKRVHSFDLCIKTMKKYDKIKSRIKKADILICNVEDPAIIERVKRHPVSSYRAALSHTNPHPSETQTDNQTYRDILNRGRGVSVLPGNSKSLNKLDRKPRCVQTNKQKP